MASGGRELEHVPWVAKPFSSSSSLRAVGSEDIGEHRPLASTGTSADGNEKNGLKRTKDEALGTRYEGRYV